jgi:hypothetical protein
MSDDEQPDFVAPNVCVDVGGDEVDIPASIQAAITVYGSLMPDLDSASKICKAIRKRLNPAKKAMEEWMAENLIENIGIGGKKYTRTRKPKTFAGLKEVKESNVLTGTVKTNFIEENTRDNDTYKLAK